MKIVTALIALAGLSVLSACSPPYHAAGDPYPRFGEATASNFAVQVINPDPDYSGVENTTSARRATRAVGNYEAGNVEEPVEVEGVAE